MVGQKIRDARKALDKSQEQMARELGVAVMTVSRWERDQHKPSIDQLYRIAAVLHVSAADLVDSNGKAA